MGGNDSINDLDREAKLLSVEKLRFELRDAALRWWQRPAWIAAIATITAAGSGLTWAIATNYFENRMRELRLETYDLRLRRDEQARLFEADRRKLETERRGYEARLAALQNAVKRLDVPVIGDVNVTGPWDVNRAASPVQRVFETKWCQFRRPRRSGRFFRAVGGRRRSFGIGER
jgi:hypothetical protein